MDGFQVRAGRRDAASPTGVRFNGPFSSCNLQGGDAEIEHQPTTAGRSPVGLTATAGCDPHHPLADATVQQFRNDGYLVVPSLCSASEQLVIRRALTELFQQQAGRREGNHLDMLGPDCGDQVPRQPQLLKPSLYAPQLLRTDYYSRVRAIARQLLGEDAAFSFDHSILKPAGLGAETPWHQDEAYRADPATRREQISFWMPLQDVGEDNGCMRYVPGSHLGDVLPHRSPDSDPRVHALECLPEYIDESAARTQPVPAGWCILHGGRTLHAALPNRAATDRIAYVISFHGPPIATEETRPFPWLADKATQAADRNKHWRRGAGALVMSGRWLRRAIGADIRSLPHRIRTAFHRLRARYKTR